MAAPSPGLAPGPAPVTSGGPRPRLPSVATTGLEAVKDALRPGVLNGDVCAAWQAVIDRGPGHGDCPRHHCGYAVGIGFPPSRVGGAGVAVLVRPPINRRKEND